MVAPVAVTACLRVIFIAASPLRRASLSRGGDQAIAPPRLREKTALHT
jgi:hypothetical protein